MNRLSGFRLISRDTPNPSSFHYSDNEMSLSSQPTQANGNRGSQSVQATMQNERAILFWLGASLP